MVRTPVKIRNGFAVFSVVDPSTKFGEEDIENASDAEDRALGSDFWNPGP